MTERGHTACKNTLQQIQRFSLQTSRLFKQKLNVFYVVVSFQLSSLVLCLYLTDARMFTVVVVVIEAGAMLQLRCQRYWATDLKETLEIGDVVVTLVISSCLLA